MADQRLVAEESAEGERIDKYLASCLNELSRSYLKKIWQEEDILVNGRAVKPAYRLSEGDEILLSVPEPVIPEILPEPIPLSILYEDSDVIVINKPQGMVVHPAPGHYTGTVVNALLYHCQDLSGINGVLRPGIVHRIDRDTSGVLIACKNDAAHRAIAEQLKAHTIVRRYYALVYGTVKEEEGTIDKPIGRSPSDRKKMAVVPDGKRAVTHYQVLHRFRDATLLNCRLETGRTHQIRVHLASAGHPVVGDPVYAPASYHLKNVSESTLKGQCLHAYILGFRHPASGKYMEFSAPLPDYFSSLLIELSR